MEELRLESCVIHLHCSTPVLAEVFLETQEHLPYNPNLTTYYYNCTFFPTVLTVTNNTTWDGEHGEGRDGLEQGTV